MERDRNLLFGVLAVQLRKITPSQLVEAGGAWAADPSRNLPDRLVAAGALSVQDKGLLLGLVDAAVDAHEGDASATLATFGGEDQVRQSFRGSIGMASSGGVVTYVTPRPDSAPVSPEDVPGVEESPGRYTHLGEYGRGGMGRVLLVHDDYLAREVALKELLPCPSQEDDSFQLSPVRLSMPIVARFLQEARITGQLEHPCIVPVYELGYRKDGTLYYTMKLVRGKTLSQAIRQAGTLEERLALLPHFVDLCQAMAYAHSRRIIHRDLKPGNVMVGEFGETVVLDWGLAKSKDREDVHADGLSETLKAMNLGDEGDIAKTVYGQALGTPAYMPPEQARGLLDEIDERSDIYSLGAVLYELLTGHTPFDGRSVLELLHSVINDRPVPVRKREPRVPPELATICEKALAKAPEDRYASAKNLAEDVERFQSGALVQAHEYGARELLRRFVAKHKAILTTAAAALVVLVAIGVFYNLQLRQRNAALEQSQVQERAQRLAAEEAGLKAKEKEAEAVAALDAAEHQSYLSHVLLARTYLNDGFTDLAIDALWKTPEEERNWEWGYLVDRCYPEQSTFTGHQDRVFSVVYSSDGKRVLSASADNTARIWDPETCKELMCFSGHTLPLIKALFNPDETRVLTLSWDKTARLWDAATGQTVLQFEGHTEGLSDAAFSPDGSRLVTAGWDQTVRLWDVSSGRQLSVLAQDFGMDARVAFNPDGTLIAAGAPNDPVRVWDAASGELRYSLPSGPAFAYSPDGKQMVTATGVIWDMQTGQETSKLQVDGDETFGAIEFSPDGSRLLTTDGTRGTCVWNMQSGALAFSLGLTGSPSFSSDGTKIVTANGTAAAIWSVSKEVALATFTGHTGGITSVCLSPDGTHIVTGSTDKTAKVWKTERASTCKTVRMRYAERATFSPDSTRLIVLSYGGTFHVVDVYSANELGTCSFGAGGWRREVVFSPDGKWVATTHQDAVLVWDPATGEPLTVLDCQGDPVGVAVSVDGKRISAAGWTGFYEWDIESKSLARKVEMKLGYISGARVSMDGQWLLVSSSSGAFQEWNLETGQLVATPSEIDPKRWPSSTPRLNERVLEVAGGQNALRGLACSKDGQRALTASEGRPTRLWDMTTGTELLALKEDSVQDDQGVNFSLDGRRIAVCQRDGVTLWEAPSWRVAEWPGDESMDRYARIELYRRENVAARETGPVEAPFHVVVALQEEVAGAAKEVSTFLRTEPPVFETNPQPGYRVPPGGQTPRQLGLETGDLVTAVNGLPLSDDTTALSSLDSVVTLLGTETKPPFSMDVIRDDEPITLRFWFLDAGIVRIDQPIKRTLLTSLLQIIVPLVESEIGQSQATDLTLPLYNGDNGLPLTGIDSNPQMAVLVKQLGLTDGDFLSVVDGQRVTNALEALDALKAVIVKLTSGTPESVSLGGWRGKLNRLEITLKLE